MMRSLIQTLSLAMRDYWHEALLSACSVLGLAAVLSPLMVLLGVHHGIITAMTERLLKDPRTLEITPVGSGKYGPEWFAELENLPGVAFVLPETRSIAATVRLFQHKDGKEQQSASPMTPTADRDPLLLRWNQQTPVWEILAPDTLPPALSAVLSTPGSEGPALSVNAVLSESLARKLAAAPGELLEARVDRVRAGRRESAALPVRVASILPPEAQSTDMLFIPLELLVATEDYRDGKAVPFLNWEGEPFTYAPLEDNPPQKPKAPIFVHLLQDSPKAQKIAEMLQNYSAQIRGQREYASFRLYAAGLEHVTPLWRWFQSRYVEVYVKSAEIDTVTNLDRAFRIVFSLVTGAALFGFMASTASNALAGVKRKSRFLGIMRLIGFPRAGILLFPVAQSLVTGLTGSLLAYILYLGVAYSIDSLFASSLPGGTAICTLPPLYVGGIFAVVLLLSAVSSLCAAWQATTIEPSEVIRDV